MEIQIWKIERVKPYSRNARVIPDSAVAKVATSIREYGWQQPIVVDRKGVIIAGHVRRLAAIKLELQEVPVLVAKGLSPAQVKAYRLMDNRSHEESTWDLGLLIEELESMKTDGFEIEQAGFSIPELDLLWSRQASENASLADPGNWEGMPEFISKEAGSLRHIVVHFATENDYADFQRLIGQKCGDKRSIWHPELPNASYKERVYHGGDHES